LRTLVISDLHLGSRLGHDVLRHQDALSHLLAAIDGIERLVLLGDILELLQGRARAAAAIAAPVLREIGRRLGPEREVLVVAGNHDRPLVRRWVRALGPALTPQTLVPPNATPALAALVEWLAPARVSISYPGAWLSERVWATHGHYLDHHLIPVSGYGITRSRLRLSSADAASPAEYELARRPTVGRAAGSLPRPLAVLLDDAAELARAATMPTLKRRLLRPPLSPLTAMLLGFQMQRASIPALLRVVQRLGIDADWVVFGHVHRLGPLAADDSAQWQGPGARPRIANSGSWLYEPLLVHRANAPHPYWPGGAVVHEDGADPQAIGLLDDLDRETLAHRHGEAR